VRTTFTGNNAETKIIMKSIRSLYARFPAVVRVAISSRRVQYSIIVLEQSLLVHLISEHPRDDGRFPRDGTPTKRQSLADGRQRSYLVVPTFSPRHLRPYRLSGSRQVSLTRKNNRQATVAPPAAVSSSPRNLYVTINTRT